MVFIHTSKYPFFCVYGKEIFLTCSHWKLETMRNIFCKAIWYRKCVFAIRGQSYLNEILVHFPSHFHRYHIYIYTILNGTQNTKRKMRQICTELFLSISFKKYGYANNESKKSIVMMVSERSAGVWIELLCGRKTS